jgi:hypothetical protein
MLSFILAFALLALSLTAYITLTVYLTCRKPEAPRQPKFFWAD